ncbi:hypothetical protein FQR65_LT16333 [Abscondita terminalis]|nr:hypothetical protein FQR65_LT16333 [Abscondita terminalis]
MYSHIADVAINNLDNAKYGSVYFIETDEAIGRFHVTSELSSGVEITADLEINVILKTRGFVRNDTADGETYPNFLGKVQRWNSVHVGVNFPYISAIYVLHTVKRIKSIIRGKVDQARPSPENSA